MTLPPAARAAVTGWRLQAAMPATGGWWESAACVSTDPELFFPDKGEMHRKQRARQVCSGCHVMDDCRNYALDQPQLQGIWGGLTAEERRQVRKAARR